MDTKTLPPRDLVRQLLRYDAETGDLIWLSRLREAFSDHRIFRSWNARFPGKAAGSINTAGYLLIRVNNSPYYAHRLVWLLIHGDPVPEIIDHIDHNPSNNRILNLRAATNRQNMANTPVRRDSTTGIKGVKRHGRGFMARVQSGKRNVYLGTFDTIEEASKTYREAVVSIHKEFARW